MISSDCYIITTLNYSTQTLHSDNLMPPRPCALQDRAESDLGRGVLEDRHRKGRGESEGGVPEGRLPSCPDLPLQLGKSPKVSGEWFLETFSQR